MNALILQKFILCLFLQFWMVCCTIDINKPEFQYIADHLTEEECHKLVAALHFSTFELPAGINAAERRLPDDVPCIDLLLHWNSTPKEGRGQTHVEVCHRLNQIGREDLAQWLSKTVFHQISKDLKAALNSSNGEEIEESTVNTWTLPDAYPDGVIIDEASWSTTDSLISILLVVALVSLVFGLIVLCLLCVSRKANKSYNGYKKLPSDDT